ncbi:MAG: LuxR C-terminal-related transcriptional regulator [Oscillospiraceae bacterium]
MDTPLNLKLLSRDRVNRALDGIMTHPLSMIVAPMGYGKTASLQSYVRQKKCNFCWITLSSSANISSADFFWFLLVRTVSKKDPGFGRQLAEIGFPKNNIEIIRIIDILLEKQADAHYLVIIDDLHLAEDSSIEELIYQIALAEIPWLHIVTLSRSYPHYPRTELQLKGILFTLDHQALAFTWEETEEYFSLIKFHAPADIRSHIFELSQGWISSIFLLANAYITTGRLDDSASVFDMFDSSLFSQCTDREKNILMKLALLDSFTLSMAEYAFDDPAAPATILSLYRKNAFIFHDHTGEYYFHQMFKDFLLKSPGFPRTDNRAFLQRVAQWYADRGVLAQALNYWLMVNDRTKVLETLEAISPLSLAALNLDPLVSIFSGPDEAQKFRYPYAVLKYAFYVILNVDEQQGVSYLDEFDRYFSSHTHELYSREQLLGESAVLRSSVAFNDLEKMMEYVRQAKALLGDRKSLFRTRSSSFTHTSPHLTYGYFNKLGEYRKVVDIFAHDFEPHIQVTGGCGAGCPALAQAEYALETGDLAQVESFALQSLEEAKRSQQNWVTVCALLTLARLYALQGRKDRLVEAEEHILLLKKSETDSATLYEIDNCLGYICGLLKNPDGIPAWIRNPGFPQKHSMFQRLSFNAIVSGKALLLSGEYERLERLSYQFDQCFGTFSYQLGFIHNRIYRAVAKYRLYGAEIGCLELSAAISAAKADHIVAPFAENLEWLLPLLTNAHMTESQEFVQAILACQHTGEISVKRGEVPLTKREIDIMEALRAGYSQAEIARMLYISPNTVKRHLQNIYMKFGTSNKTQAINKYMSLYEKHE